MSSELRSFLDASPTPYHVCSQAIDLLKSSGFSAVPYQQASTEFFLESKGVVHRDGALIAWNWPVAAVASRGAFLVGAHTDSPGLKLKPQPQSVAFGWNQLNVEIYGGVLLNSWLDRDLGIAGRIYTKNGEHCDFVAGDAIARVPQLAIHLDRDISEKGLSLHRQQHMKPIWGTDTSVDFFSWLAGRNSLEKHQIASCDLSLYDIAKSALLGHDRSLLVSGRIDNQASCWAAVTSLSQVGSPSQPYIVALFDHEEVGSASVNGAAGPLLEHVLQELLLVRGESNIFPTFAKNSLFVSADNAHGIHPNYPDRHDSDHAPQINMGPAVKVNVNQRYATHARSVALVTEVGSHAKVPLQLFASNNAQPCGSTIGPIAATRLGIDTVDIGIPQLSMHSAREMCGVKDPGYLVDLLSALAIR